MKTPHLSIPKPGGACALLLTLALASANAQVPPAPAGLPAPPAVPAPPRPVLDESRDVDKIVARAHAEAAVGLARAQAAQNDAHKALAKVKGDIRWLSGSKSSRVLVVPSAEPDPEAIAHLEEDLTIMGRLIEKAVDSKERQPKALGIDVLTFAGPGGAQHMYVGGHGAIFTLRVKFPLSAPPEQSARDEKKDETSTTWEEARREVFGSGAERNVFGAFKEFERTLKDHEEYDANKVERLTDSIIDSLKHGTQIRHLPADEHVTVVVTSGSGGLLESRVERYGWGGYGSGFGGAGRVEGVREKVGPATVMTIQAKKSDVDAFAKGSIDADSFREKVKILRY